MPALEQKKEREGRAKDGRIWFSIPSQNIVQSYAWVYLTLPLYQRAHTLRGTTAPHARHTHTHTLPDATHA
jgi:hypothetical protein